MKVVYLNYFILYKHIAFYVIKLYSIEKRKPFLQLLLEATKQGIHMSDEEILSQVDTFMFEVTLIRF